MQKAIVPSNRSNHYTDIIDITDGDNYSSLKSVVEQNINNERRDERKHTAPIRVQQQQNLAPGQVAPNMN